MQREQRVLLMVQRFEPIATLERHMFEYAFAAFYQAEHQLGASVQVKTLPAAGETAEAAHASTPKRNSAKAITAELEILGDS